MFNSTWVTAPSWLSRSLRPFLYSSSVYSCHLLLISSASVKSLPLLSFIKPIFAWNVPLVSLIFMKRFLVLPILLSHSISLHLSLKKAFFSLLAILWNSSFRWVYLSHCVVGYYTVMKSNMLLTKATMSNMVLSKRCQTQNTLVYDFKSQQHSSIVSEVRHAATFEAE